MSVASSLYHCFLYDSIFVKHICFIHCWLIVFFFFSLNLGRIFGTQGLIDNRKNKNICQIYFFKMVISQLDSDLTATVKNQCWAIQCSSNVFYCSYCLYYLLSSMLKPFGYTLSNFRIQNFSFLLSC